MNIVLPTRMTVDEFLLWSQRQTQGRYELQDGRVIMQQAQNISHLLVKARMFDLLRATIERAGVPYYALPDGATVRIKADTCCEPDALVAPLPMPALDELEIPNPVLVVEVLSPTSKKRDLVEKLANYGKVASILHYLGLDPEKRVILHHERGARGLKKAPRKIEQGKLRLEPPGIELDVGEVFGDRLS